MMVDPKTPEEFEARIADVETQIEQSRSISNPVERMSRLAVLAHENLQLLAFGRRQLKETIREARGKIRTAVCWWILAAVMMVGSFLVSFLEVFE